MRLGETPSLLRKSASDYKGTLLAKSPPQASSASLLRKLVRLFASAANSSAANSSASDSSAAVHSSAAGFASWPIFRSQRPCV